MVLKEKEGSMNGHQVSSWCLRFLGNVLVFCVCNVFCSMSKENTIERLQRIVRVEKVQKVVER
jgi:hypothetical protein